MSTLHKFKAYFGMVPLEDFEDDYIDEPGPPHRDYSEPGYPSTRRDEVDDFDRYGAASRQPTPVEPMPTRPTRPMPSAGARGTTRGSLAVDSRMDRLEGRRSLVDEGGPLSKITTLCPRDYGEARTIGERFRDGNPVIMDLVEMSNADAKRLVDFAAGLAFALRGSFDKVATKVFLLSPAGVDVSAEERRRIAETGYYNQK
ncbi:cell division protein SepF [Rhodococcus spongiicola]|uniref:Cell division protein SepF n=1 Tax=Rhodococcus spongiicola TaxID=2487352 RepID=A0A438ANI9_9NOCA|nr:cell division protein SepF [Rhodococcus spongiicola]RVW00363.1 cell division protein SepF [Rhodococcus spongiicola]